MLKKNMVIQVNKSILKVFDVNLCRARCIPFTKELKKKKFDDRDAEDAYYLKQRLISISSGTEAVILGAHFGIKKENKSETN